MTLLRWLIFLLISQTVIRAHSCSFFLSSDASICSAILQWLSFNSDHVVVSVSIDFLTNTKRDALFHRVAYDYSCGDWDGPRSFDRCSMGGYL